MKSSGSAVGALLTAVSALGFSSLPIFSKVAYQAGANVTTALTGRFLIAALFLWLYLLIRREKLPGWRVALILSAMGGVGYTTMSFLYLSSVEADRLSPAMAALLLYTYPAIVVLLAWLFEGQRLGPRRLAALALALGGVALVLVARDRALFSVTGALFALGASVVYAIYIVVGGRVMRRTTPIVAATYVTTAAAGLFLGYGAAAGELVSVTSAGWWAMFGMAIFPTVVAVLCFYAGLEILGSARTSIISTLEPVGTVLLSAVVFGDFLAGWQVLGAALVVGGIVWLQAQGG